MAGKGRVQRQSVDLEQYPDMIVIYLGMRMRKLAGLKTILGLGPQIEKAAGGMPDGLLLHENFIFSLVPPHVGMRQYWRDYESLEAFTRSEPHRTWWTSFLKDSGGTGFWHETYSMRGGMEAIYDDVKQPVGMMKFASLKPARGSMFSARRRLKLAGDSVSPPPVPEEAYYGAAAGKHSSAAD